MKHLHLECVGGASGDMILGVLVELGVSREELVAELSKLPLGTFNITTETAQSKHITGLRLTINVEGQELSAEPAEPHDHVHEHTRDHAHDHVHHDGQEDHHHHHEHRALSEIASMIHAAELSESVKKRAVGIFTALGHAESKIHGVPVEDIHFHEVGAADSILDIVGSCWALEKLGVKTVSVGSIPMGHGVIRCAHGVYPNPAPATLELLYGMPLTQVDEPFELVTPTGAALLSGWKNTRQIPAGAHLVRTAYSVGRRNLHHRPNILRASLYDAADGVEHDSCLMLECNLDDTTPELLGLLVEELMAQGALDVTCTPVTMKKQRSGILLSVLGDFSKREMLLDLVFRGSTTFGVREYVVNRTKLVRRFEKVSTPYGDVTVKIGTWRGEDITRAPEISDCRRIAIEKNVSVRAVYEAAARHQF